MDEKCIQSAIASLYETLDGRASWETALQAMAFALSAQRLTIVYSSSDKTYPQDSWPADPDGVIEYGRDYADKDLRTTRIIAGRRGLLSTRDLMSDDEIAHCPVHQEFYRRWPECWNTLMCPIESDDCLVVPLVQRGAIHEDFDQSERRILGLLAPHIEKVASLNRLLPTEPIQKNGLMASLDAFDEAVVLLDARGVVRFMNRRAASLDGQRDGFRVMQGVLVAADPLSRNLLDGLISGALRLAGREGLEAPQSIILRRQHGKKPFVVSAAVVPETGNPVRLLIRIREPADPRLPPIESLQAQFGLTSAEANVALALAEGRSLLEYAEAVGITAHTVRSYVANVREKMKVRRQGEVVRLVLGCRLS